MFRDDLIGQTVQNYSFIDLIGEGALAKVYYCVDIRNNTEVAIKAVAKVKILQNKNIDGLIKTQIKILRSCDNENIIKFISNFTNDKYIFIVTEFCNEGDLQQYLDQKQSLSQAQATKFIIHILNGFKGLHQVSAMHRDFKLANVLLHNGICKIADLGFAKQMFRPLTYTVIGTHLTMAPEVLQEKPYGKEADIWSLGVVYYQMIYGKYPYEARSEDYILKKIKTGSPSYLKVNISPECKDFIDRCLQYDPKKRITWEQIYTHPLIQQHQAQVKFSRSRLKDNLQLYKKQLSNKKILYPGNDKSNGPSDNSSKKQIKNNLNFNQNLEKIKQNKQIQNVCTKYQKEYLLKKNNIMFIFKFIAPYVHHISHLKAEHNKCLFIVSKKAVIELRQFYLQVQDKTNIFKFNKYWQHFISSKQYQNVILCLKNDLDIATCQCLTYKQDIEQINRQIQAQLEIDQFKCSNYNKLILNTINEYWYQLAAHLQLPKGIIKDSLIKVLEALHYYNNRKYKNSEQFDRMITLGNMVEIQKRIKAKYI